MCCIACRARCIVVRVVAWYCCLGIYRHRALLIRRQGANVMMRIPVDVEMAAGFGAAAVALVAFTSLEADGSCAWFWTGVLIYKRVCNKIWWRGNLWTKNCLCVAFSFWSTASWTIYNFILCVLFRDHIHFSCSSLWYTWEAAFILYWTNPIVHINDTRTTRFIPTDGSFLFVIWKGISTSTFHKYLPVILDTTCVILTSLYTIWMKNAKSRIKDQSSLVTLLWCFLGHLHHTYLTLVHSRKRNGPLRILRSYRFSFVRLNVADVYLKIRTNGGSELCVCMSSDTFIWFIFFIPAQVYAL